jgi:uncharacterized membrane protein
MRDGIGRSAWLLLPKPARSLPADLGAVVVLLVCSWLFVLVPGLNDTPLRILFGLPLVLFLPGYALIAALFPEAGTSPTATDGDDETDSAESTDASGSASEDQADEDTGRSLGGLGSVAAGDEGGIDGIERVALSFGLSIAVVPLIGLIANFTPWGIRLVPILVGISAFTLGMVALAARRRHALPEEQRFRMPYREWFKAGKSEAFSPESRRDGALNVLLALSILLAVGAVGYAVMVPPDGESFTEFYVLTEDEEENLVAAEYPTEFELGESQPLVVGIGNHEGESIEYSVVVQLQEVERSDNETTVVQRQELDRFSSPLIGDNETWHRTHDIQPSMTGENLRVQYLLYRSSPPATPTAENAYRTLHLWIDVGE